MRPCCCLLLLFALALPASAGRELDDLLAYDLSELLDVEVYSASKSLQPASEAPATVRVITARQIKERGYRTLEEALADLPGFQFRDIAGFNSYVFLRGVPSQNNLLLVLVDGVQVNELNSGGFYGGWQYNLNNVKRIEVVYGPASALYGTNAVSGIVNVITNSPADLQGGGGGALAGGSGERALDFRYGRQEPGGWGLSLAGKMSRTGKQPLGGARGDNNWSARPENFEEDQSFDGKAVYKDLTLGVLVQEKAASRTTLDVTQGTSRLDFGTRWHIRFANVWLKHVYDKSPGWSLESRTYYRQTNLLDDTIADVYSGVCSTCGQQGYYRPNDQVGLESQLNLKPAEALALTAGAVLEHESLSQAYSVTYSGDPLVRPAAPGSPAMTSEDILSVYSQARWTLLPGLALTGGVRRDHSSGYGQVATPRAGLVYHREALTLKLLYAEAFRAPRPWDYNYGAGNPGLKPETMRSLEVSAAYLLGSGLAADLSVYRNKVRGLLGLAGGSWVNGGAVETGGLEARLEYAANGLRGYLHYAYQDSADAGARTPEVALHSAGAGAACDLPGGLRLDLRARYSGERPAGRVIAVTGADHVGAALIWDAGLTLARPGGLELALLGRNLFNERYYHTSNRTPDRYPQAPRQFLLRASFSFGAGGRS